MPTSLVGVFQTNVGTISPRCALIKPLRFNKERLRIEDYKDWLADDADSKFAKCKICFLAKNRFALLNIGEQASVSHMKGKKHIQLVPDNVQDRSQPKISSFLIKLVFLMRKVTVAGLTALVSHKRQCRILYMIRKLPQMQKSFWHWRKFSLIFY